MPQPNKIPLAFAASGDKNVIPESTETTGLASWRDGFPVITSVPFSEGGIAPKRADFNGIFYALSQAVMWLQQGGVYAYDVNTDYEAGNVVLDAGGLYVANTANGPSSVVVQPSSDTTGATWKFVRLNLATQAAAGYMSAADKSKLDGIDLSLYALLNSPAFAGTPTAPTPEDSDNSTRIATTAYVNRRLPFSSGTWTPVFSGGSSDGAFTYSEQKGIYARLANLVFIFARLDFSMVSQPTGQCFVKGLPFVSASSVINYGWHPFINIRGYGGVDNCLTSIAQGTIPHSSTQMILRKTFIPDGYPGVISINQAKFGNRASDIYIQLNNNTGRFDITGMYFTQ